MSFEQTLPAGTAAELVLAAPAGSVLALGGIDGEKLRVLLDSYEPEGSDRRALFVPIVPAPTADAIVEQVIDLLAETGRRLWPIWFTDVSFKGCRNDTLGRLAAAAIVREAAENIEALSPTWAQAAARLALDGRPPRVPGTPAPIALTQLALTISRSGLVLVADLGDPTCIGPNAAAMVHALEWIAKHARAAVVALFADLPATAPPFDHILYGARRVMPEAQAGSGVAEIEAIARADPAPWIAPWRGLPHPLSEAEQRLAKALGADCELAPLFGFNQLITTTRGSRPKVDLVWPQGRLVVELDGYESHGGRTAFMYDRHRDYELALSGYTVLRLANDEIAQDIEKAVEKIRDLVRICRARTAWEG
jgi:hypothetical protein